MPILSAEIICCLQSPHVFDEYYSHSAMCSFGQKFSPDTYLNSKPSTASRPPGSENILSPVIIHIALGSPLQTVLSEELQVLESSSGSHKRK